MNIRLQRISQIFGYDSSTLVQEPEKVSHSNNKFDALKLEETYDSEDDEGRGKDMKPNSAEAINHDRLAEGFNKIMRAIREGEVSPRALDNLIPSLTVGTENLKVLLRGL